MLNRAMKDRSGLCCVGPILFFFFFFAVAVTPASAACLASGRSCGLNAPANDRLCCPGMVCGYGSVCQPGCRIDGTFYRAQAKRPGNVCQSCQPNVSTTSWSNVGAGTACGDPSSGICDAADTCGGGVCRSNHVADGTGCGTPGVCEVQDTCLSGSCRDNGFKTAAAACGDPSAGACDNPDHCSGTSNTCVPNHVADGTNCGTPGVCEVQDTCLSGSCRDNGFKTAAAACGDPSAGACDNPDHCSGTSNTCLSNHVADGAACGTPSQCEAQYRCASGLCVGNGFAPDTTPCAGNSQGHTCDLDSSDHCSGADFTCVDAYRGSETPCDDGDGISCTGVCGPAGGCLNVADDSQCDDGDSSTVDSCVASFGCTHAGCATFGGTSIPGLAGCWYLGALGQSCAQVCAGHSLSYSSQTLLVAGGGSTIGACATALAAVGAPAAHCDGSPASLSVATVLAPDVGCSYQDLLVNDPARCDTLPDTRVRYLWVWFDQATSPDSAYAAAGRVCACEP